MSPTTHEDLDELYQELHDTWRYVGHVVTNLVEYNEDLKTKSERKCIRSSIKSTAARSHMKVVTSQCLFISNWMVNIQTLRIDYAGYTEFLEHFK
jgi:hypothetical protein